MIAFAANATRPKAMERQKSCAARREGRAEEADEEGGGDDCAAIFAGPVSSAGMVEAEAKRYEGEALERLQRWALGCLQR